jgi:hypothetical protein
MKNSMRRVKLDTLTTPRDGLFQVYCDSWWATSHEDELYFFGTDRSPFSSPQCNSNEGLARRVHENMTKTEHEHCRYVNYKETRQIPVVFVPVNISDYI